MTEGQVIAKCLQILSKPHTRPYGKRTKTYKLRTRLCITYLARYLAFRQKMHDRSQLALTGDF